MVRNIADQFLPQSSMLLFPSARHIFFFPLLHFLCIIDNNLFTILESQKIWLMNTAQIKVNWLNGLKLNGLTGVEACVECKAEPKWIQMSHNKINSMLKWSPLSIYFVQPCICFIGDRIKGRVDGESNHAAENISPLVFWSKTERNQGCRLEVCVHLCSQYLMH